MPWFNRNWFREMQKEGKGYKTSLLWIVAAIDRSNSTHLEAVNDGRVGMRNKILRRRPDLNTLRRELEKDIQSSFGDHLLYDMC